MTKEQSSKKEIMPRKQLEKIAIEALEKAYQLHEELGGAGEELVQKNQFGEMALRVDIEAERAIMDTLKEANVPIRVISEEHGITEIGKNPIYLGILDGLDGSGVYKEARAKGRYGTMFGIFPNLDPQYDDYLFSGVMEHSTKRLFFASKDKGSFVMINGERFPIHCSGRVKLDKQTRIYIDEYWDINKKTFSANLQGFNIDFLNSSAPYYIDVASGRAGLALECTRKGNLEIAVAYGLITEAGGVMVTLDGISLGQRKYKEFGQDKHVPVVTAATKQLAQELIEHIS